jgi:hypothetical protein
MPRKKKGSAGKEIAAVRRSLRALDRSLVRLAELLRANYESGKPGSRIGHHRELRLSPARLKALRLHGKYIGYLRYLKSRAKAEVRALRAKQGVRAAIARARRLAGR